MIESKMLKGDQSVTLKKIIKGPVKPHRKNPIMSNGANEFIKLLTSNDSEP